MNKKQANNQLSSTKVDSAVLSKHVLFYQKLNEAQKKQFETEVAEFLNDVKITAVNTNITELHNYLIASSAVIPVFAFPEWKYGRLLNEVLVYDDTFSKDFKTEAVNRNVLGMVGTGYLDGKMLLSKHALELGFNNQSDKNNTAIHEFVHLIDKADGDIDGVPKLLLDKQYVIPWIDMVYEEMEASKIKNSDINAYGYTNKTEFFAVIAEYFFERPDLFSKKHPKLFEMMSKVFKQK